MKIQINKLMRCAMRAGTLGLGCVLAIGAHAEDVVLPLQTHAAYFSTEMRLNIPLDPQVFIADPSAAAGVGPQQIQHVAGLRNARMSDSPILPVFNARNKPLGMTLGAWLGAHGDAILTARSDGTEKVTVVLSNLVPGGRYSLFENHFDQQPVGFTPLDRDASSSSFIADASGNAVLTTIAPTVLTHDNAVLVVYHSDGQTHGQSRGEIGLTAHHQLIAQP